MAILIDGGIGSDGNLQIPWCSFNGSTVNLVWQDRSGTWHPFDLDRAVVNLSQGVTGLPANVAVLAVGKGVNDQLQVICIDAATLQPLLLFQDDVSSSWHVVGNINQAGFGFVQSDLAFGYNFVATGSGAISGNPPLLHILFLTQPAQAPNVGNSAIIEMFINQETGATGGVGVLVARYATNLSATWLAMGTGGDGSLQVVGMGDSVNPPFSLTNWVPPNQAGFPQPICDYAPLPLPPQSQYADQNFSTGTMVFDPTNNVLWLLCIGSSSNLPYAYTWDPINQWVFQGMLPGPGAGGPFPRGQGFIEVVAAVGAGNFVQAIFLDENDAPYLFWCQQQDFRDPRSTPITWWNNAGYLEPAGMPANFGFYGEDMADNFGLHNATLQQGADGNLQLVGLNSVTAMPTLIWQAPDGNWSWYGSFFSL